MRTLHCYISTFTRLAQIFQIQTFWDLDLTPAKAQRRQVRKLFFLPLRLGAFAGDIPNSFFALFAPFAVNYPIPNLFFGCGSAALCSLRLKIPRFLPARH
ncbi:MAG: hypothetical protein ACREPG_08945 [Candidatus Binatia bacterium]